MVNWQTFLDINLIPSRCGIEVAEAWCYMTNLRFLILFFIVAITSYWAMWKLIQIWGAPYLNDCEPA